MIKVEFERQVAAALLTALQRRLEFIHHIENHHPQRLSPAVQQERSALAPAIVALEHALKQAAHCS